MKFLGKNIWPAAAWAALLLSLVACKKSAPAEAVPGNVFYTCSMDPQVMEKRPGTCPICKMALVRIEIDPNQKAGELSFSEQQTQLATIQTYTVLLRPLFYEITLSAVLK